MYVVSACTIRCSVRELIARVSPCLQQSSPLALQPSEASSLETSLPKSTGYLPQDSRAADQRAPTRPVGEHLLTIVRIGSGTTARILRPSCKAPYALTERELATAFSGYSPVDQAKQQRTLSFSFESSAPFDWSQAKTFASLLLKENIVTSTTSCTDRSRGS